VFAALAADGFGSFANLKGDIRSVSELVIRRLGE
jgi:hypothetical protein